MSSGWKPILPCTDSSCHVSSPAHAVPTAPAKASAIRQTFIRLISTSTASDVKGDPRAVALQCTRTPGSFPGQPRKWSRTCSLSLVSPEALRLLAELLDHEALELDRDDHVDEDRAHG